jgi:hypothetical protein
MAPLHHRLIGRPAVRAAAIAMVAALALAGCDVFDFDEEATSTASETEVIPEITVTIPPSRLTPFCQAIIDLRDEIQNDPPADTRARIIEVYESIVDEAPPEIRDDFLSVLASLQSGEPVATAVIVTPTAPPSVSEPSVSGPSASAPSTSAPVTAPPPSTVPIDPASTPPTSENFEAVEGYDPDTSPTLRLNLWIQENCRSTVNNPGPSDTQPLTTEP